MFGHVVATFCVGSLMMGMLLLGVAWVLDSYHITLLGRKVVHNDSHSHGGHSRVNASLGSIKRHRPSNPLANFPISHRAQW